jgi:DNA-directed RNA polymerase sigma subunit (sigma70/sigma32)
MGPKTGDRARELELLAHLQDQLSEKRAALEELVQNRNREILRATDYYGLQPEEIGTATNMTPQRVRQILSEQS